LHLRPLERLLPYRFTIPPLFNTEIQKPTQLDDKLTPELEAEPNISDGAIVQKIPMVFANPDDLRIPISLVLSLQHQKLNCLNELALGLNPAHNGVPI